MLVLKMATSKHTDPSGHFIFVVPILLALWTVAEVSLSVYDGSTTYQTVADPCISN